MWRNLATLLSFVTERRTALVASVALAVASTVLEVSSFVILYIAAAGMLAGTASSSGLLWLAALAVACTVGRFVLWSTAMYVSHIAAFDATRALRLRVADHLTTVPLGEVTSRRSGEIKKLMGDDADRLELVIAHAIPEAVSAIGVWLAMTCWLAVVDWRMALAAAGMPIIAFVIIYVSFRTRGDSLARRNAALASMNGSIVEVVHGLPALRVFGRPGHVPGEVSASIDRFAEASVAVSRHSLRYTTAFYNTVLANALLVVPIGSALWLRESISTSQFVLFLIVGLGYSLPLLRCFQLGARLVYATSAGRAISEVLDIEPLADTGRWVELGDHSVELRDVTFTYPTVAGDEASARARSTPTCPSDRAPGSRPALDRLGFTAAAGEVTALVGPSGAGKSSVARLLARFWDPDTGSVRIGGVDIRDMAIEQLMETVSFVFQEPFLFHDTVAANIRMGRPGATDAEVADAARAAQIHEFVLGLDGGYDHMVTSEGSNLSGGERQRIALARAMLRDAPIVVLDEATAFADPENEAAIQAAVSRLIAGRTLVVIAHRLDTIVDADQIVVIDAGRVVEHGTHPELLHADGLYRRLWGDHQAATLAELGAAVRGTS